MKHLRVCFARDRNHALRPVRAAHSLGLLFLLASGCQLVVDPDPGALSDGGEWEDAAWSAVRWEDSSAIFDAGPRDASGSGDAGSLRDASVQADASPHKDGSAATDASTQKDSSAPTDAGPHKDGSTATDASTRPDGSTATDASMPPVKDATVPAGLCSLARCPANTYCDDISGTAQCIPLPSCSNVSCAADTACQLVDVYCFRAPCPPVPTCVAVVTACSPACGTGEVCDTTHGHPKCVADQAVVPCGALNCAAGLSCCNANCSMCVAPGVACAQLACSTTP